MARRFAKVSEEEIVSINEAAFLAFFTKWSGILETSSVYTLSAQRNFGTQNLIGLPNKLTVVVSKR